MANSRYAKPKAAVIRFDLPIDGAKVRNVDELREHFTTDVIGHFRSGVLAKWLRARQLNKELAAVEALSNTGSAESSLLLALCEIFNVDADEQTVAAALAEPTGASAVHALNREIALGIEQRGRCRLGHQDQWRLEIPAPAVVELNAYTEHIAYFALSDQCGRQLLLWRVRGREQRQPIPLAYLPAGRYDIQVRAGQGEAQYSLRVNEISRPDPAERDIKLSIDSQFSPGYADLWQIFVPGCGAEIWTTGPTGTLVSSYTCRSGDSSGVLLGFNWEGAAPPFGHQIVGVRGDRRTGGPYTIHARFAHVAATSGAWCALTWSAATEVGRRTFLRDGVTEQLRWRARTLPEPMTVADMERMLGDPD